MASTAAVETLRDLLKPVYREVWLPYVRAAATRVFRLAVDLAAAAAIIRPARQDGNESFLVIHLAGHLGDTVMLLPMLEALRRAHPGSRIDVAVEAAVAPLLRQLSVIDHVHCFRLGSKPPVSMPESLLRAAAIIRLWWPMRYQLQPTTVVLPRWGDDLFRSTTLAYLTKAPRRIGFASVKHPGQTSAPYRDALLTDPVQGGCGLHEPARMVYLLEQSGLIPLVDLAAISTCAIPALAELVRKVDWCQLSARLKLSRPFAVIAPGASMQRRVWPVANWLPAVHTLAERGIQCILLAGPADLSSASELHQLARGAGLETILIAGLTTLAESAAIIAHAAFFLGNDSGPGHLAGALAVPSVILFIAEPGCDPNHPAAPERVRPAGPHVHILRPAECIPPCTGACSAAVAHCITAITPDSLLPFLFSDHIETINHPPAT